MSVRGLSARQDAWLRPCVRLLPVPPLRGRRQIVPYGGVCSRIIRELFVFEVLRTLRFGWRQNRRPLC